MTSPQVENDEPKGKKRSISTNTFTQAEDYLDGKYEFRLNVVNLSIEHRLKDSSGDEFKSVNENSILRELYKVPIKISMANLISLLRSDFVPEYDPLINYFQNLPDWDQVTDHISTLAEYVEADDPQDWKNHFKKQLVRTVQCVLDRRYFNKQALILVSPEQNSGKSTFIRFLCPEELNEYIAEDMTSDKDSRILLVKNFMINLDELAKWGKKDIDTIKSYFSKTQINERLPYDRKNSVLTRRASFYGSTNRMDFLTDETGSVRWICFHIKKITWSYKNDIDIHKVWSQAYSLFKSGFQSDMTIDEIAENEKRNRQYFVKSIEQEYITKFFNFDEEQRVENFLTATDVMGKIYNLIDHRLNLNHIQIGRALTFLQCPKGKVCDRYGYFLTVKTEFNPPKEN